MINVVDKGADPTGQSDSRAAIQAALDAAAACPTPVYFPSGTYLRGPTPLVISSPRMRLVGDGIGLSRIVSPGGGDVFDARHGQLAIEGLTIDGGANGVSFGAAGDVDDVRVRDCEFLGLADSAVSARGSQASASRLYFDRLLIRSCNLGLRLNWYKSDGVHVTGCDMRQLLTHGIMVGNGLGDASGGQRNYAITGNTIDGVTNPTTSDTHGIIVYGERFEISGNSIANVSNVGKLNCEGIYTKGRFGTVARNTLVDAGYQQAAIAIKGVERGAEGIPGWGMLVTGNVLVNTRSLSQGYTVGIDVNAEDARVVGNYLEGFACAISGNEGSDLDNVDVSDNDVIGTIGYYAINWRAWGHYLSIRENRVRGITGNGIANSVAIWVHPNGGKTIDHVLIERNKIYDMTPTLSTKRGIAIRVTSEVADAQVRNLVVRENYAVTTRAADRLLESSGQLVASDCAIVAHNTTRGPATAPLDLSLFPGASVLEAP